MVNDSNPLDGLKPVHFLYLTKVLREGGQNHTEAEDKSPQKPSSYFCVVPATMSVDNHPHFQQM